ncbi:winged helix-turn-helix domain-containing protein [Candidatus Enterococcus ferrettii]|uniref:OmpR/PhoB-type domain-containing protein n=1 Tax=Candidatus Enterococcus ferrettii TaxID=2815324 RepID=A0ABV0ENC9_9ENTE|nr:helix-turn-helix domain-containing protein [Enterococcus sp. 665A]MBO1340906.1 winged helix-turn-helix domain-containing protein [Enterococcus sp. 665A]
MKPILLLTKSILHEVPLQQRLQEFNQEVFSTSELLPVMCNRENQQRTRLLFYFSRVLISETVGDIELGHLLPTLQDHDMPVIRVVDNLPTTEERKNWEERGVTDWLPMNHSLECLRETVISIELPKETLFEAGQGASYQQAAVKSIRFSKNERKLIELMLATPNQVWSRQQLCQQVWGEESESNKSQLSFLISKIKRKLNSLAVSGDVIETHWGSGYLVPKNYASLIKELLLRG